MKSIYSCSMLLQAVVENVLAYGSSPKMTASEREIVSLPRLHDEILSLAKSFA